MGKFYRSIDIYPFGKDALLIMKYSRYACKMVILHPINTLDEFIF
jgi:hypothetical protein